MTKPFEFVDSISNTKEDLIAQGSSEQDYIPWLTNKALSYHSDAILYANEMNGYPELDRRLQYDYLRLSLRKRERRAKWHKADDVELVELISWRFQVSHRRAKEIIPLLSADYVDAIRSLKESMSRD